jgi:septum formation protein
MRKLILASASPRRSQLLREAGFSPVVVTADVEEAHDPSLSCEALTIANALLKARAVAAREPSAIIVGGDTLVYVDGDPLAKPATMEEGRLMLRRLSGRSHQVCTGVAIVTGQTEESFAVITHVNFKPLSDSEIEHYHSVAQVLDKAGGYGIQEHGDLIIHSIEGSYSNVMGLPMETLTPRLHSWLTAPPLQ